MRMRALYQKGVLLMNHQRLILLRRPYAMLAAVVLLAVLVGCRSEIAMTPTSEAVETAPQMDVLESPLSPTAAPAIASEEALAVSPLDLTPAPGTGLVQGLLLLEGKPAPERTLYLAPLIASGEEMEIAALDPVEDDRAESDGSGVFVFVDVEPGRYALGINSPIGPVLIRGDDGDEIVAEVVAGEIVDLEVVRIVPF